MSRGRSPAGREESESARGGGGGGVGLGGGLGALPRAQGLVTVPDLGSGNDSPTYDGAPGRDWAQVPRGWRRFAARSARLPA